MKISRKEVLRIAGLARLNLTPDEQAAMGLHLEKTLDYVAKLSELDPEIGDADSGSNLPGEAWREDQNGLCLSPKDALGNAPQKSGHFFTVPRVI